MFRRNQRKRHLASPEAEPSLLDSPVVESRSKQVEVVEVPEIMPGLTLSSLVEGCVTNPDRTVQIKGLLWGDVELDLPNVSPATHIQVASEDGTPRQVDINQAENPFTPARIIYTLGDDTLELRHNDVADEGGHIETIAPEEISQLEARVTQLFQQYFVQD